jgi:hypothetical protein
MSKLTRTSMWLLFAVSLGYGLLFLYVTTTESDRTPFVMAPRSEGLETSGEGSPYYVVARFIRTLDRNAGRRVVAESELPYSREQIEKSILAARQWARDLPSHEGQVFFGALLVELQNFVPAENIKVVTDQQILEKQLGVISKRLGRDYRWVAWHEGAIPIGKAKLALEAMYFERISQYAGFLAVYVWFGFLLVILPFKLWRLRHIGLWRTWQFWVFLALFLFPGLLIGAVGYVTAQPLLLFERVTSNAEIMTIGFWTALGFAVLLPLFAISGVFDLLLNRTIEQRLSSQKLNLEQS